VKGKRGKWAILGLLIFVMMFASACSSDQSSSDSKDNGGSENKNPIKIGVLASKTGENKP
jgi:branched-chain amino acid transport system substrate-binding protein